jgi:hypothetical protein
MREARAEKDNYMTNAETSDKVATVVEQAAHVAGGFPKLASSPKTRHFYECLTAQRTAGGFGWSVARHDPS